MIRRLFWAGLGAAVGITGYRRISRRLTLLTRGAGGTWGAGGVRGAAGFVGDVRAGMAEYLARYPAHPGPGGEIQRPGAGQPDSPGGSRAHPGIDYVKDGH